MFHEDPSLVFSEAASGVNDAGCWCGSREVFWSSDSWWSYLVIEEKEKLVDYNRPTENTLWRPAQVLSTCGKRCNVFGLLAVAWTKHDILRCCCRNLKHAEEFNCWLKLSSPANFIYVSFGLSLSKGWAIWSRNTVPHFFFNFFSTTTCPVLVSAEVDECFSFCLVWGAKFIEHRIKV